MKLLERYLADFNRDYWDRQELGPWGTLAIVLAAMVAVGMFLFWR
jgi:hypothetical protein